MFNKRFYFILSHPRTSAEYTCFVNSIRELLLLKYLSHSFSDSQLSVPLSKNSCKTEVNSLRMPCAIVQSTIGLNFSFACPHPAPRRGGLIWSSAESTQDSWPRSWIPFCPWDPYTQDLIFFGKDPDLILLLSYFVFDQTLRRVQTAPCVWNLPLYRTAAPPENDLASHTHTFETDEWKVEWLSDTAASCNSRVIQFLLFWLIKMHTL